jgi:hypothetical protein
VKTGDKLSGPPLWADADIIDSNRENTAANKWQTILKK